MLIRCAKILNLGFGTSDFWHALTAYPDLFSTLEYMIEEEDKAKRYEQAVQQHSQLLLGCLATGVLNWNADKGKIVDYFALTKPPFIKELEAENAQSMQSEAEKKKERNFTLLTLAL